MNVNQTKSLFCSHTCISFTHIPSSVEQSTHLWHDTHSHCHFSVQFPMPHLFLCQTPGLLTWEGSIPALATSVRSWTMTPRGPPGRKMIEKMSKQLSFFPLLTFCLVVAGKKTTNDASAVSQCTGKWWRWPSSMRPAERWAIFKLLITPAAFTLRHVQTPAVIKIKLALAS